MKEAGRLLTKLKEAEQMEVNETDTRSEVSPEATRSRSYFGSLSNDVLMLIIETLTFDEILTLRGVSKYLRRLTDRLLLGHMDFERSGIECIDSTLATGASRLWYRFGVPPGENPEQPFMKPKELGRTIRQGEPCWARWELDPKSSCPCWTCTRSEISEPTGVHGVVSEFHVDRAWERYRLQFVLKPQSFIGTFEGIRADDLLGRLMSESLFEPPLKTGVRFLLSYKLLDSSSLDLLNEADGTLEAYPYESRQCSGLVEPRDGEACITVGGFLKTLEDILGAQFMWEERLDIMGINVFPYFIGDSCVLNVTLKTRSVCWEDQEMASQHAIGDLKIPEDFQDYIPPEDGDEVSEEYMSSISTDTLPSSYLWRSAETRSTCTDCRKKRIKEVVEMREEGSIWAAGRKVYAEEYLRSDHDYDLAGIGDGMNCPDPEGTEPAITGLDCEDAKNEPDNTTPAPGGGVALPACPDRVDLEAPGDKSPTCESQADAASSASSISEEPRFYSSKGPSYMAFRPTRVDGEKGVCFHSGFDNGQANTYQASEEEGEGGEGGNETRGFDEKSETWGRVDPVARFYKTLWWETGGSNRRRYKPKIIRNYEFYFENVKRGLGATFYSFDANRFIPREGLNNEREESLAPHFVQKREIQIFI